METQQQEKEMAQLQDLPNEILEEIITRLPTIRTTINFNETNTKFKSFTRNKGWKTHYINNFQDQNNTAQQIKDTNNYPELNWYEKYKKEYENEKQEERRQEILHRKIIKWNQEIQKLHRIIEKDKETMKKLKLIIERRNIISQNIYPIKRDDS